MPYLGNPPAEAYTTTVKDSFSGDGSTTAFTLSQPSTTNDLRVVVENVIQDPTVAYSVSGTTLTFLSAPPSGTDNIYAVNLGPAVQTVVPPDGVTLTNPTVTGDLTVDTNTLYVDSANNRVGVGTASPSSLMHVSSSDGDIVRISGSTKSLYFRPDTGGCMIATSTGQLGTGIYWSDTSNYLYFQTNSSEAARFNSSGNLVFPNGQGIDFSSSAGSGASSSLLDDYEEGTWTPAYSATTTAPTVTYTIQVGIYVKIGHMVYAQGRLRTNTVSGGSGNIIVGGLPYAANYSDANNYNAVGVSYTLNWNAGYYPSSGYVQPNGTYWFPITFNNTDANGGRSAAIDVTNLNTGSGANDMIFSFVYRTT